jgi:hypothetical protein
VFNDIPQAIADRMAYLETIDARDRTDGTSRLERLRQIPPETDCYEAVVPTMTAGGILVADNAVNHEATLRPMLRRALTDDRVDALVVPIGKGELVCRKR